MDNKNKKKLALTGGSASAEALRQINPDVMPVYPITPQTPIIESFAKLEADGKVDTEIVTVESEHSAISAAVGSAAAGARTVTATSSQGLALMNEILYIASGMRLPITMLISARALSAPINIHGDHSDVMGARDTGWIQLFSENSQEVYDNTIIGTKLAEKTDVPIMVIMDGFTTSHSVENLETLSDKVVEKFVGPVKSSEAGSLKAKFNGLKRGSLLDTENPRTFGPVGLPNSYFEFKLDQEEAMLKAKDNYQEIVKEFEKVSGRSYDLFEKYKIDDAEHIVILAGSTAGIAKDVVDKMRDDGKKVGLLKIKLFRPFPFEEIAKAISKAKNIAVMDRAISSGSKPPLYTEVVSSLHLANIQMDVNSYVYALGGREIFAKDIEEVFESLIAGNISKETKYIK